MHLGDGFLDAPTCLAAGALATAGVAAAFHATRQNNATRAAPLVGAMSACIFALQMVQFPVLPGASGHVVGSALAALVLGPAAAIVALTIVLIVQCFLFADGGVAALGANVLNIAIVAPLVAHGTFRAVRVIVPARWALPLGAGAAGWASLVAASAVCAVELSVAGAYPLRWILPSLTGIHAVIALVEGALTGGALAYIARTRSDLLPPSVGAMLPEATSLPGTRKAAFVGCCVALAAAMLVAPWSSAAPDGLEYVVESPGAASLAPATSSALLPDYQTPGIAWPWAAKATAGGIGVGLVLGAGWLTMRRSTLIAP